MPDKALGYPSTDKLMACLVLFFDAMSGVEKLATIVPAAITLPT